MTVITQLYDLLSNFTLCIIHSFSVITITEYPIEYKGLPHSHFTDMYTHDSDHNYRISFTEFN